MSSTPYTTQKTRSGAFHTGCVTVTSYVTRPFEPGRCVELATQFLALTCVCAQRVSPRSSTKQASGSGFHIGAFDVNILTPTAKNFDVSVNFDTRPNHGHHKNYLDHSVTTSQNLDAGVKLFLNVKTSSCAASLTQVQQRLCDAVPDRCNASGVKRASLTTYLPEQKQYLLFTPQTYRCAVLPEFTGLADCRRMQQVYKHTASTLQQYMYVSNAASEEGWFGRSEAGIHEESVRRARVFLCCGA